MLSIKVIGNESHKVVYSPLLHESIVLKVFKDDEPIWSSRVYQENEQALSFCVWEGLERLINLYNRTPYYPEFVEIIDILSSHNRLRGVGC